MQYHNILLSVDCTMQIFVHSAAIFQMKTTRKQQTFSYITIMHTLMCCALFPVFYRKRAS